MSQRIVVLLTKIISKGASPITQISKNDLELLIKNGIIRNTNNGFKDKQGRQIGFYRTKSGAKKRYIEDWYAGKAIQLKQK